MEKIGKLDEEFKYTLHKKVFNLADATIDDLDEVLDLQNIKGEISPKF